MTWFRPGAAILLLWLVLRDAEWHALQEGLRSVRWRWLAAAVALRLLSLVFASLRWQVLLTPVKRVPLAAILTVVMMGMAVTTGVSMQAAEVARPYLLSQRQGLDFGATVATLAVEWLFDLVAVMACVIPAMLWMRGRMPALTRLGVPLLGWACVVMALAFVGLVALRRMPANGGRWRRWMVGVRILHEPRRFGPVAAYSLLVSLFTALSAWLALVAFGVSLSWAAGSLLLGLISLGGLMPTPGAVGGFHAVCQWGLVTLFMVDRVSTVLPVIGLHAVLYLPAAAIGTLCFLWQRRVPTRVVGTMVAALVVAAPLAAQGVPGAATGLEPDPSLSAADIFSRMVQRNAARAARVQAYDSIRRYTVFEPGHEPDAELVVSMRWVSPATKIFATTSERGVGWIHKRIFRGLINAEIEAATGAEHRHSDIVPANYHAQLVGTDRWRGRACYLLALTPARRDKYLFRGTAWIDTEDYAMAKLEAEPAKSPSFWVIRAPFVREYQRLDGFWLPVHDETHPQVRFVGDYILRIEYAEYHITSRD